MLVRSIPNGVGLIIACVSGYIGLHVFGSSASGQAVCGRWQSRDVPGVTFGTVSAATDWDPDGPAGPLPPRLVIGGSFLLGGAPGGHAVAEWDGDQFRPLLSGNAVVYSLTVRNGRLVAGGNIDLPSSTGVPVVEFDGVTWRPLGQGLIGSVFAMTEFGGELYAAGRVGAVASPINQPAAVLRNGVWLVLPAEVPLGLNMRASAIAAYNGQLYIAGRLGDVNAAPSLGLQRLQAGEWQSLRLAIGGDVTSLAEYNGELIVGGDFQVVERLVVNRVFAWNGSTVRSLRAPFVTNSSRGVAFVSSMCVQAGRLFVAGALGNDAVVAGYVAAASYDGTNWRLEQLTGSVRRPDVRVIRPTGSTVVVGGTAIPLSGEPFESQIALRVGSDFQLFQQATAFTNLVQFRGEVYATGVFANLATGEGFPIARRDGDRWVPVPAFAGIYPDRITVFQDRLIGSGTTRDPDGNIIRVIFSFDGTTVTVLGAIDGTADEFAEFGGELFVGGGFSTVGDLPAANLAAWNGTSWRAIPGSPNSLISAMGVHQGKLYVGGAFNRAGGRPANRIAAFDGSAWTSLASGIGNGEVTTIVGYGPDVFVGGTFTASTNQPGAYITRWDGQQFNAVDGGVNASVSSMLSMGGRLFVTGGFNRTGAQAASGIAAWNGTNWAYVAPLFDLASARFGPSTLVDLGGVMHAVGSFNQAAGAPDAAGFVAWTDGDPVVITLQPSSQTVDLFGQIGLQTGANSVNARTVRWRRNGVPLTSGPGGASPGGGTVVDPTAIPLVITGARLSDAGVYDAVFTTPCGSATTNTAVVRVRCPADTDDSGTLSTSDLLEFVARWFAGDPRADITRNGTLGVQDIFAFLDLWFAGC